MMGFPLPPPVYSASCSFFSLSVNLSVCSQLSCFHSNDCFVVKTQKVSVWLIISMLKDLLSTLKPPLHITLVVLLFFHSLSVCFSLFLTYRPRQASKGRKTREPTPTELTFKLHPIPPGTKGTALNIRLNPEICMKKKKQFSPAFKRVQRDNETSSKRHVLLLPLRLPAWQSMNPTSFRFQFYSMRWRVYLLYLSIFTQLLYKCCADRWASLHKLYHNPKQYLDTWCLMCEFIAFEHKRSNQVGAGNKQF